MSRSELDALLRWIDILDATPIISEDDEEADDG